MNQEPTECIWMQDKAWLPPIWVSLCGRRMGIETWVVRDFRFCPYCAKPLKMEGEEAKP